MKSRKIIVTGSNSGIGRAVVNALLNSDLAGTGDIEVFGYDLPGYTVLKPQYPDGLGQYDELYALVNCAGVNHLDWLRDFPEANWNRVMDVNAKGIFLMSQFFLSNLQMAQGTILNIVSDAAHKPMRCSIAYNASKAAAHIMTLQMARELTRDNGVTVFGVAPSHIADTGMSRQIEREVERVRGWSPEQNRQRQLDGSVTGAPIDLLTFAEFIAYLLSTKNRHRALSGCVLPYGA